MDQQYLSTMNENGQNQLLGGPIFFFFFSDKLVMLVAQQLNICEGALVRAHHMFEGDQPPFPLRRKPGNKKHKSPSRLRRQRARKQRFQDKKTAEKADSPKSPASEVNTTVLQDQKPTAVQEPEPACVTSTKDSSDLDNTGQIQDLVCGSDKCSEKQVLSPDSDISIETERALLLEVLQQTDTDSDDNSFDISEVISEVNTCSNCKCQPQAGVELKRCSRCQITKYCSVDCQKKDCDFHRFACSVVAKSATKKT